jgi:hypothetical protein
LLKCSLFAINFDFEVFTASPPRICVRDLSFSRLRFPLKVHTARSYFDIDTQGAPGMPSRKPSIEIFFPTALKNRKATLE